MTQTSSDSDSGGCGSPTEELQGELFSLIGSLQDGALITEAGLAKMFGRHPVSIKRAIERGELPPPIYLLKRPMFSIGGIRRHLCQRSEEALEEQKRTQNMVQKHRNTH